MKVTMVAVCSADGLMTRGADTHVPRWSSKEDSEQYRSLVERSRLLVMGRKTFEAMQLTPQAERLCVVLTRTPEEFAAQTVAGQLEFSAASPAEIVASLEARGYDNMLVLGGGQINGAFLQANLVNEVCLTIEPTLFGVGTPLLGGLPANVSLHLQNNTQLNENGTLLLHYTVAR